MLHQWMGLYQLAPRGPEARSSPESFWETENWDPTQTYPIRICILTDPQVTGAHVTFWEALIHMPQPSSKLENEQGMQLSSEGSQFTREHSRSRGKGGQNQEATGPCPLPQPLHHRLWPTSVQFSPSAESDSLQTHGPQHARLPCPSPTPGVHSNPCPSSRWCHPTISPSVVPFSSCPQSFLASGSFLVTRFFTSGGQSTGVAASASVLPMNIQDWSPSEWTGWISLQSEGLSRVFSNTRVQKHQFFGAQLSL